MGALCADANGVAAGVLDFLTGKAAAPALTLGSGLKIAWLSAVRANNNGSDTEWTTGGGYTQTGASATGGVLLPPASMNAAAAGTTGATATNGTAVTLTNAPALSWAGNRIQDNTATNKNLWYAPITGGAKSINAGDTCTLPQTTGLAFSLG